MLFIVFGVMCLVICIGSLFVSTTNDPSIRKLNIGFGISLIMALIGEILFVIGANIYLQ